MDSRLRWNDDDLVDRCGNNDERRPILFIPSILSKRRSRPRRGFALVIALLAVAISSALMLAALYYSASYVRTAQLESLRRDAFTQCESSLWTTLSNTSADVVRSMQIGTTITSAYQHDGVNTEVKLTRADTSFVWIVAVSSTPNARDVARHRLGLSAAISRDRSDQSLRPVPDRAWSELF